MFAIIKFSKSHLVKQLNYPNNIKVIGKCSGNKSTFTIFEDGSFVYPIIKTSSDNLNYSVFLGKIYNIGSQVINSNSDIIRILLEHLEKYGSKGMSKVNGSYIFMVYDFGSDYLKLYNDRYSSILLYYFWSNDFLIISNTIKSIINMSSLDFTLNSLYITDMLTYNYVLGTNTPFKEIKCLPAASHLKASKGKLFILKYWDFNYGKLKGIDYIETREAIGEKFVTAISRRISSNDQIILPLSGGLDSRAILGGLLENINADRILTFTFGARNSYEQIFAKKVAKKVGVKHIPLPFDLRKPLTIIKDIFNNNEGMYKILPDFPSFQYQQLQKYGQLIFSGYLGDPLMGSHIDPSIVGNHKEPKDLQDYVKCVFSRINKNPWDIVKHSSPKMLKNINPMFTLYESLRENKNENLIHFYENWYWHCHSYKRTYFAVLVFRNLFIYVTPFLDNELLDFVFDLPLVYRVNQRIYKDMLIHRYGYLFDDMPVKGNVFHLKKYYIKEKYDKVLAKLNVVSEKYFNKSFYPQPSNNYVSYRYLFKLEKGSYWSLLDSAKKYLSEKDLLDEGYLNNIMKFHSSYKKDFNLLFQAIITLAFLLKNVRVGVKEVFNSFEE
ncbi:7-cyano-7-deazaguanine synthase [candidate division KSB1 bacterium]|nr:7-cyano-7-deazaguanine synthase [candidate division KSB1 bacterium]